MTETPVAGQTGCHRPDPVLLLTPSRQHIDKEALMRTLLDLMPALLSRDSSPCTKR